MAKVLVLFSLHGLEFVLALFYLGRRSASKNSAKARFYANNDKLVLFVRIAVPKIPQGSGILFTKILSSTM